MWKVGKALWLLKSCLGLSRRGPALFVPPPTAPSPPPTHPQVVRCMACWSQLPSSSFSPRRSFCLAAVALTSGQECIPSTEATCPICRCGSLLCGSLFHTCQWASHTPQPQPSSWCRAGVAVNVAGSWLGGDCCSPKCSWCLAAVGLTSGEGCTSSMEAACLKCRCGDECGSRMLMRVRHC